MREKYEKDITEPQFFTIKWRGKAHYYKYTYYRDNNLIVLFGTHPDEKREITHREIREEFGYGSTVEGFVRNPDLDRGQFNSKEEQQSVYKAIEKALEKGPQES